MALPLRSATTRENTRVQAGIGRDGPCGLKKKEQQGISLGIELFQIQHFHGGLSTDPMGFYAGMPKARAGRDMAWVRHEYDSWNKLTDTVVFMCRHVSEVARG